jgi:hypothetical protein
MVVWYHTRIELWCSFNFIKEFLNEEFLRDRDVVHRPRFRRSVVSAQGTFHHWLKKVIPFEAAGYDVKW